MKFFCHIFQRTNKITPDTSDAYSPSAAMSSARTSTSRFLPNVTLIELFQSQGCDSCPPANKACIAIAARNDPSQLLLTYEVTYWDHLGWPDTFGDARWNERQSAYAAALKQRSCYTPQVLVDGGSKPLGSSWRNLGAVLEKARETVGDGVRFERVEGTSKISILGDTRRQNLVLAVFYEIEPAPVRILRGENKGETLPHRNIVRDIKLLGTWQGGAQEFELPAKRSGLEMAVLVQAGEGGPILGAARV